MGLSWVILPYRQDRVMPALRRKLNAIYWLALQEQSAEYGLDIRLDESTNKIVLFNPTVAA
jgi:hypothetical protein